MRRGWADRLQAWRVSMAGPYDPPTSDGVHKCLHYQSLVLKQGLDSTDPDSIPSLLLPQLWSGGGGGCEGTPPSGIGTRHAVAFPGRGGSGSRRASCCGTGAQPALSVRRGACGAPRGPCEAGTARPVPQRVVKGSQPTQCQTLGLARGSGPFEPPTRGSFPLAPQSPRPLPPLQ